MHLMVVTLDVSQSEMSPLKFPSQWNKFDMSVTFPTHYEFIGKPNVSDTSQLQNKLPQSPSMYSESAYRSSYLSSKHLFAETTETASTSRRRINVSILLPSELIFNTKKRCRTNCILHAVNKPSAKPRYENFSAAESSYPFFSLCPRLLGSFLCIVVYRCLSIKVMRSFMAKHFSATNYTL